MEEEALYVVLGLDEEGRKVYDYLLNFYFYDFPQKLWISIYTTNPVERDSEPRKRVGWEVRPGRSMGSKTGTTVSSQTEGEISNRPPGHPGGEF